MQKYKNAAGTVVVLVVLAMAGLWANSRYIHWRPFGSERHSQVSTSGTMAVTKVEKLTLECRARVTVRVPIHAKRDDQVDIGPWTQTVNTDHASLTAIGDVDVCVRGTADVNRLNNGHWLVTTEASNIVFERPRVDNLATMNSVRFSKGWVGKLVDAIPWVSDNNALLPASYAYAQGLVSNSRCMSAAWGTINQTMKAAYAETVAHEHHVASNRIQVVIDGMPNFGQHDGDNRSLKLKDFNFQSDTAHTQCAVATQAANPQGGDNN